MWMPGAAEAEQFMRIFQHVAIPHEYKAARNIQAAMMVIALRS